MSAQDCEQLSLFPGDSHASRSPSPGSEEAVRMTVTSGRKCSELLQSSGPIGLLEKMLLESSVWRSTRCLLTWKTRVTPQGRLLFRLAPSTPRTAETDAPLWPTVRSRETGAYQYSQGRHDYPVLTLTGAVRMWPTPSASDCGRTAINPYLTGNGTIRHIGKSGKQSYARLDAVAALFPTPRAQSCTGASETATRQGGPDLQTAAGGQLNPGWVEWLMGFPPGWTEV